LWVAEDQVAMLEKARVPFLRPTHVLTYHLSVILKRYAGEFIGLQETKYLLEQMEAQFPEISREVQRVLPVQKITEVLQRLVQEEVSIRNLRSIFQALIDWGQKEKEPVLLTEYVRSSLRRYISYKFSRGQNILAAYLLEPDVEERVRKAIRQTSAGSYLALDPASVKKMLQSVRKEVGNLSEGNQRPVLLTSMDVRRYTRKLVEQEFHDLPVLSHQELTEEITIQPLGRITM
jgi:type III secretion protein V